MSTIFNDMDNVRAFGDRLLPHYVIAPQAVYQVGPNHFVELGTPTEVLGGAYGQYR